MAERSDNKPCSSEADRHGDRLVRRINGTTAGRPLLTRRMSAEPGRDSIPRGFASWKSYNAYFGRFDVIDIDSDATEASLKDSLHKARGIVEEDAIGQWIYDGLEVYIVIILHEGAGHGTHDVHSIVKSLGSSVESRIVKIVFITATDGGAFRGAEQLPFVLSSPVRLTRPHEVHPTEAVRDTVGTLPQRATEWGPRLAERVPDPIRIVAPPDDDVSIADAPSTSNFSYVSIASIKNYRSLRLRGLDIDHLDSPFVIIHGTNGSGKTSLIELLYLAQFGNLPLRKCYLAVSERIEELMVPKTAEAMVSYRLLNRRSANKSVFIDNLSDKEKSEVVIFHNSMMDYIKKGVLYDQYIVARLIDDLNSYTEQRDLIRADSVGPTFLRGRQAIARIDGSLAALQAHRRNLERENIILETVPGQAPLDRAAKLEVLTRVLTRAFEDLPRGLIGVSDDDIRAMIRKIKTADTANQTLVAHLRDLCETLFQRTLGRARDVYNEVRAQFSVDEPSEVVDVIQRKFQPVLDELDGVRTIVFRLIDEMPARAAAQTESPEAKVGKLKIDVERCAEWIDALRSVRRAFVAEEQWYFRTATTTLDALAPVATMVYRAIDPGAARRRIEFGSPDDGNALFRLVEDVDDAGREIAFSTWHQLSAAQRINIGLSIFLARTLDENTTGSFLMDEAFLHLDAYQRTNLLDLMRAILVRRGGRINFIITTADEFLLTHAASKMRLLRRYFDPETGVLDEADRTAARTFVNLASGDRHDVADTLREQAASIREQADRRPNAPDELRHFLDRRARAADGLAQSLDLPKEPRRSSQPVVVHRLEPKGDTLGVRTFYPG